VYSNDAFLDHNPDELWNYFVLYLQEPPTAYLSVEGHHIEYYYETKTSRDAKGNVINRRVRKERQVTDFSVQIGLNRHINASWSRLYASGGANGGGFRKYT
jgi:hypothetical protein